MRRRGARHWTSSSARTCALLARHQGKVAFAAQEAGVDRVYLYRLLRKHALQH